MKTAGEEVQALAEVTELALEYHCPLCGLEGTVAGQVAAQRAGTAESCWQEFPFEICPWLEQCVCL